MKKTVSKEDDEKLEEATAIDGSATWVQCTVCSLL